MDIIYSDNHLLVVSKPAGVSTQPHEGDGADLLTQAKAWVKSHFQKPGAVFLEPIHRLDKPVSGLVLFARTSKALSRLQEMMRKQQIERTYFAQVEGVLPQCRGTLEHYLVHEEHHARVVLPEHPQAKLARLHYVQGPTFIEITLETGRYHQIRAQFSAIGCPILGDKKYGSTALLKGKGIALHHGRMTFSHPVTKEEMIFTRELAGF